MCLSLFETIIVMSWLCTEAKIYYKCIQLWLRSKFARVCYTATPRWWLRCHMILHHRCAKSIFQWLRSWDCYHWEGNRASRQGCWQCLRGNSIRLLRQSAFLLHRDRVLRSCLHDTIIPIKDRRILLPSKHYNLVFMRDFFIYCVIEALEMYPNFPCFHSKFTCLFIVVWPTYLSWHVMVNRCDLFFELTCHLKVHLSSIGWLGWLSHRICRQTSSLEDGACLGGLLDTRLTHVHYINAQEELFNMILTLWLS